MRLCCPVLQLRRHRRVKELTQGDKTCHWFLLLSATALGQENPFPAPYHQLLSHCMISLCFQLSPQASEGGVKTVLWPELFFTVSPSSAPLNGSCSTGKAQGMWRLEPRRREMAVLDMCLVTSSRWCCFWFLMG